MKTVFAVLAIVASLFIAPFDIPFRPRFAGFLTVPPVLPVLPAGQAFTQHLFLRR